MKKSVVLALIALFALTTTANTASVSISFTAGQNTYTQNTLIPQANNKRCAEYGLSQGCTSAQVVTAGCVAEPFSAVTKTNLVFRSCTIYTQDAAGEALYHADQLYEFLVKKVSDDLAADVAASCAAFKALSGANQNAICTSLGRPNGCRICP